MEDDNLAVVPLRIELPAHGHSFTLQVPSNSSILDVKHEIQKSLTGAPRVDGQKVIWRGRYLNDAEKLAEIWPGKEDEPRIVHLAVNPSAWTAAPPTSPPTGNSTAAAAAAATVPTPTPTTPPVIPEQPTPAPLSSNSPMKYILQHHQYAASVLTGDTASLQPKAEDGRKEAMELIQNLGYTWPAILDAAYPTANGNEGGLYAVVRIKDQDFLELQNGAEPSERQKHALEVLSYTCTMLTLPSTAPSTTQPEVNMPPYLQTVLEQHAAAVLAAHAGLPNPHPNVHLPPNPVANAGALRQIRFQMIILPMLMLLLRTGLLLYFIAPARKPVFAVLIFAWVVYEIYRPIRNVLALGRRRMVEEQVDGRLGVLVNPRQGGGGGRAGAEAALSLIDSLGHVHLGSEDQALQGERREEPGWRERAWVFMTLLVVSAHPGMWDRRRAVLREREGRIRGDASIRDEVPPTDEEGGEGQTPENEARTRRREELIEEHRRRPDWVKEYMQRVVNANWVDEAD